MNTKDLLQKTGMLAVLALALASCSEDELINRKGAASNAISFGIASPTHTTDSLPSRSPQAEEPPLLLLGEGKRDTLYLHTSITENRSVPAPQKASTRGVPVNNGNFASVCKSFGVTAYTEDGALFINDKEVTPSGDKWTTEETYFWPEGTLHFYAHAPYNNNNITIKNSEKQISFSHTVPDEATAQPDILFAYKACSKAQSTGGTVPLEFYHALAGVKFVASDITAGTIIQSITLKNLYGAGSCTYTYNEEAPEGTEKGTFAWTPSGDKKDFKETLNVKSTGETEQAITTPQATFMMIPQDLTGVTVEVAVQTADGQNYTLTGSLAKTGVWEAGKIYTYYISTESINWEYVFEVTPSITFALGETQKTYNVTSYRYRKGDPNNTREAVAWSAEYVKGTETDMDMDPEGGGTSDIAKDNVLSKFTYNGNGAASETPTSYDIEVLATTLHTTYDGDEKLQKATPKGSSESPYDLSTEGGAQTTANCYVVNAPGTYELPLVYGNAIVNGSTNTQAYQGFKDYKDQPINGPEITGAYDATLVWSDGFYMFKDIQLSADKKYLVFTINADFMQQANAVLAVRDNAGHIMWSWHIWVTERDVYNTTHTVDDYFDSSKKYYMMQCNLGWVDGKMVYYNQRDLDFKFTQQGSGKTDEMKVTQKGYAFDYKDVGSTYYQWGRKDPLVALRNWKSYLPEEYRLHETGDPKYAYKYTPDNVTIGESIQNPNVFYVREGGSGLAANWCKDDIADLWDVNRGHITADGDMINITTSVKTIYDPSPRGFKVPVPRAFSVFVNGGYTADGSAGNNGTLNGFRVDDEVHNKYRVYPQKDGKETVIPFTATGQRADLSGRLEAYENGGPKMAQAGGLWSLYGVYYWTCISLNKITAYTLVIRQDWPSGITAYSFGFNGTKTMARPVRPFKE